ncbi:trypsin-like peptidase domain-containing protein [Streptacidiphilus carbonis]|jgi:hypothetical protein|uniref:trypsin-like peptidase domain-containing protein n=1 Tax=Streptacidiphilus carbonis TaxID=105422 RepID=UPI0005A8B612|nr:trypsin-like peptidase domain-containing protein [Streptacidiphilus carbonis]
MESVGRLVRNGKAVGTAFLLTADGLAATAAHVLVGGPKTKTDDIWTFEPLTAPGLSFPVMPAQPPDAAADVALLSVDAPEDWQPLPLISHASALPGSPVHLRGFAVSRTFDSGTGSYVGETADDGHTWVKVSCRHAQPGMSGAPVLLTGAGGVIGLVSARLNAERWNRDTLLLAPAQAIAGLAGNRLQLVSPVQWSTRGTLRLSWMRGEVVQPVLETDDFHVSLGRSATNRIVLGDSRDSRFHGHLALVGTSLVYQHLGAHSAFLLGPDRQLAIARGESCTVADKDRLRMGSGTLLVEMSSPDLFDPHAKSTDLTDD